MFTGIIETTGTIINIVQQGSNKKLTIKASFTDELKIDQSVAHNGVCLTVIRCDTQSYDVIAIEETLQRTQLNSIIIGDEINLERCLRVNDRIDGHIVQGHVDTTAICSEIENKNGSWIFKFAHIQSKQNITVEKGSICVNGVSLTVVESGHAYFSVAIIPFTYKETNFKKIKIGDQVNLEFDIIGKYVRKMME